MSKALFLDRDGVINKDFGYVCSKERFVFIDGIFELCLHAQELGYLIIVITNQSAIGRGIISEEDFLDLNQWMLSEMKNKGINVDEVYFSPHHPDFGVGEYMKKSIYRKPNPGMFLLAKSDFKICMKESVNVGNKCSDIRAGLSAGVKRNYLFSSDSEEIDLCRKDCFVISDLKTIHRNI